MCDRLTIESAELNADMDGTNEAKVTLSDGTEIFLTIKDLERVGPGSPKHPELVISNHEGRAVMGLDVEFFRPEEACLSSSVRRQLREDRQRTPHPNDA